MNHKNKGFGIVLPTTLLAYCLILMDNSIVFTSSVEIGNSFQMSSSTLAWVSNAYTLTFGGFLLLSGRLSDLIGRKRIFQIGLGLFGLASLVNGLSPSASVLIAARAVQGIGSSIIAPTTLALMMDAYTGEMRTRAIAYYGATAGIGSSIGLLVGGGLTSFISWRAGFLINVPLAVILILVTQKYIRKDSVSREEISIDLPGSLMSVAGLASVIFSLSDLTSRWGFLIAGLAIMAAFLLYERRVTVPILPLELFRSKIRTGAYITRALFMMACLPYWFLLPQQMQAQYGFTALGAGAAFLPVSIVTFVTAMNLPRLTGRFGNNQVLLAGELFMAAGLFLSAFLDFSLGYWIAVAGPMVLIGIGSALIAAPVTAAGVYQAPDDLAGAASGLTNTMHQIGGPIGLSIILGLQINYSQSAEVMGIFTVIGFLVVLFTMIPFRGFLTGAEESEG